MSTVQELESRIERLEKQLATRAESSGLKKVKIDETASEPATTTKAPKAKRAPSAYNTFMKEELAKLKASTPEGSFDRKAAFKQVANAWSAKKGTPAKKEDGSFWG